ncbi:unnamed protein product, partial [Ectocarpus sp. 12 AP-2014]
MVDFWGTTVGGRTTCGALAIGVAMSFARQAEAVELPPSLAPPTGGDAEYDAPTLLYVLATNFLLYVALVLITYLVVKLYIESAPGNPLFEEATTYNRVPATHSGLELTSMTVQARIAAAQGAGGGGSTGGGGGGTIMTPDGARRDSAGGLSLSRQSS